MRLARVHVIGAGLAGLATAVRLAASGVGLTLHEAAQQAGGRCRSYFDAELGCRIDNGNHLLVSGNEAAMAYIAAIGAAGTFNTFEPPRYEFHDLADGAHWTVRPNDGHIPWWILAPGRGVAGARALDYLSALKLARAGEAATVAATLDPASVLYRRLWRPLCVAALNTEPEAASARLLHSLLLQTFGRGGAALRPVLPKLGLSESLVDPALSLLSARGAEIRYAARLRGLSFREASVASLSFAQEEVAIGAGEAVVLALPASVVSDLLPDLEAPHEFRAIVNAHYRWDTVGLARPFVGVIGGDVDWVFVKPGVVSTTTSAAQRILDIPAADLGPRLWREVARALDLAPEPVPRHRIVKEKRATFAATPAALKRRPGPTTTWRNLYLAGDWTDTGWPATIEGAVRSGFKAASVILGR